MYKLILNLIAKDLWEADVSCTVVIVEASFERKLPNFKIKEDIWYNRDGRNELIMIRIPEFGTGLHENKMLEWWKLQQRFHLMMMRYTKLRNRPASHEFA